MKSWSTKNSLSYIMFSLLFMASPLYAQNSYYMSCKSTADCPSGEVCIRKGSGANECRNLATPNEDAASREKERQKGIDSINCETYAKNSVSNQRPAPPPGPAGGFASFAAIFAQTTLIGMNAQEYYDSCMKRLGY